MKTLLIVGYGDIARRAAPALQENYEVHALSRHVVAEDGVRAIQADLDDPTSLSVLAHTWDALLHFAPPGDTGDQDHRTRHLVETFRASAILPRKLLYISTSGVYGDCGGAWVDETRATNPQSQRAKRRVDAETSLKAWHPGCIALRVPGIYAQDRLPLERVKKGTPVLRDEDDVYTNHIHAEDLAAVCVKALERAPAGAIYNVSDDSELKMGAWFDLVADRHGLPRPPRISRAEAAERIPPALYSFMCESRRLSNRRMKQELEAQLRYPTVVQGLDEI